MKNLAARPMMIRRSSSRPTAMMIWVTPDGGTGGAAGEDLALELTPGGVLSNRVIDSRLAAVPAGATCEDLELELTTDGVLSNQVIDSRPTGVD